MSLFFLNKVNLFFAILVSLQWHGCFKDTKIKTVNYTFSTNNQKHDTIVLLVLGQSNAANSGSEKHTSPYTQTQNFYNGNLYALADPLYGSNGNGGSVWSHLGQQLFENGFAKHVIVAPVAIGGTRIERWIPGGNLNHLIVEAITSLKSKNLKVTHVLWHQGESNNFTLNTAHTPTQNAQQYQYNFMQLVQQIRSLGVDAPIFPAMTSRCKQVASDTALINAQRDLANDSLGIYNGPNTDVLGNEYRADNCHFNGQGLKKHALLWANIIANH